MKKLNATLIGTLALLLIWAGLTAVAWFLPSKDVSASERRKLAQFPELTADTLSSGQFQSKFETYTLDQFPLRDSFRRMKALFSYDVLHQADNNGIYLVNGYAAKLEYPLNQDSVANAMNKFNFLYTKYLEQSGSKVYAAVVPDKGYFLAEKNGYPAMDYDAMFAAVKDGMPYAQYIDLTDCLTVEDYYRTDTHWRHERLFGVADRLCSAMGVPNPDRAAYTPQAVNAPFYGVYYGQAALPLASETVYKLDSSVLSGCTVTNLENKTKYEGVYDDTKLDSQDLYDLYLSGSVSLLTIENPNAPEDRELIVFRDSFGSSIAPLLAQGYSKITLVDIRYLSSVMLGNFVDFHGQDVLFIYSTLVLNNSATFK